MKALVILHDPSEGLGTLGDYLAFKRVAVSTVCLSANEVLPETVDGYDAVFSMGGPMNVYEDETYPFLREEAAFLKQAIYLDVPTLGICLGAQMIARACGAEVSRGVVKELGWKEVSLTNAGSTDRLFSGLPETLTVFQWHEDAFDLPVGGTLLATSGACPHQAFRFRNAYGLQFHVEVTPQMLSQWFSSSLEGTEIIRQLDTLEPDYVRQALRLYSNFVEIMRSKALSSFHLQSTPAAL